MAGIGLLQSALLVTMLTDGPLPPRRCPRVDGRLSDLEVYQLLVRGADSSRNLANRCWSTAAATALSAAAAALRVLASALYRANIGDPSHDPDA